MKKLSLKQTVNEKVESMLSDIYDAEGVQTGDITPLQSLKWDELVDQLTDLFAELISQNKGGK